MVVAHNIMAMNAQRQFNIVGNSKKKSTERLSSGYRINRAADDAAGLSISEKMRRQIRGLNQGANNTMDGISLLQVADGALSEVDDMLHRMTELSIQAANGTYTDEDRKAIQQEISALKKEVDRVSEITTFNERKILDGTIAAYDPNVDYLYETQAEENDAIIKKLLDGSSNNIASDITLSDGQVLSAEAASNLMKMLSSYAMTDDLKKNNIHDEGYSVKVDNPDQVKDYWHKMNEYIKGMSSYALNKTKFISSLEEADSYIDGFVDSNSNSIELRNAYNSADSATGGVAGMSTRNLKNSIIDRAITSAINMQHALTMTAGYLPDKNWYLAGEYVLRSEGITSGNLFDIVKKGNKIDDACNAYRELFGTKVKPSADEIEKLTKRGLWIQTGAEPQHGMYISIDSVSTLELGIGGIDVSTQNGAEKSIDNIKAAVGQVGEIRSRIGAQQNRLEHTYKSVTNVAENTTAAESRIRDTDMAKEMEELSKQNILEQVGQSMMAQANQSKQGVLSLLQ